MRYAIKKLREFLFPSVKLHVTILSAIQVYPFYEMCQGIMNNPVFLKSVMHNV
jgi:hypothetical protein